MQNQTVHRNVKSQVNRKDARAIKKKYTHISISFNQQNSFAVHFTNQSKITRKHEVKRDQPSNKKLKKKRGVGEEKKGKQKGNNTTGSSPLLPVLLLPVAPHA